MTRTKVTLRELTRDQCHVLEHLAASRTAQTRTVERARLRLAIAG